MAFEDREKTTFMTMWGTFTYKVTPFGLKNVRETYERAVVTLFHDMMHKEIEVVITVSRSTWMITKINRVTIDLFCTSVIGHSIGMALN